MKKILCLLMVLLCFGCMEVLKPKTKLPQNQYTNDNLQDIDKDSEKANTEYKVPLNIIIKAIE